MRTRLAAPLALGLAALAAVLVLAAGGDDDAYRIELALENAGGLRVDRPVRVGGAEVGKVESLELDADDSVIATLALEPEAQVDEKATAQIKATNLLGERFVQLEPGDGPPAPSGARIPPKRITEPVDLDQVLNVLDADTRTRFNVLINEAGLAFTDRKADWSSLLEQLPPSLDAGTELLSELVNDNHTLGRLIDRSDGFIARLTEERRELSGLIDSAGEAMASFAGREDQLRETLAEAPAALRATRRLLAELRGTAGPLGPAARALSASAPPLTETLQQLGPFQRAAEPTLEEAERAAPALTELAQEATPVLRKANPTLRSLNRLAGELPPLGRALDEGIDDTLTTVEGWARATQTRDGLSHVFRGHLSISSQLILGIVRNMTKADLRALRRRNRAAERQAPQPQPAEPAPQGADGPGLPLPELDLPELPELDDELERGLGKALDGVDRATAGLGRATKGLARKRGRGRGGRSRGAGAEISALLDYLMKP